MNRNKKIVLSGLFTAIGIILPLLFHHFGRGAGTVFLPLHISAILAGLVLGLLEGVSVAVLSVTLSFLITGMPPAAIMPFIMAEVMLYGLFAGIFKNLCRKGRMWRYIALIATQICGRIFYAIVLFISFNWLGIAAVPKVIGVVTGLATSFVGVITQIVIIPLIVGECLKNDTASQGIIEK